MGSYVFAQGITSYLALTAAAPVTLPHPVCLCWFACGGCVYGSCSGSRDPRFFNSWTGLGQHSKLDRSIPRPTLHSVCSSRLTRVCGRLVYMVGSLLFDIIIYMFYYFIPELCRNCSTLYKTMTNNVQFLVSLVCSYMVTVGFFLAT